VLLQPYVSFLHSKGLPLPTPSGQTLSTDNKMHSRVAFNLAKSGKNLSSRQFEALTSRSWRSNVVPNNLPQSTSSVNQINKQNPDEILDGIFSRSLPLSHATINCNPATSNPPFGILDPEADIETIQAMNRNARRPKKANRGARPCSRASRRAKKDAVGKRRR
jgi:hypothetical protein